MMDRDQGPSWPCSSHDEASCHASLCPPTLHRPLPATAPLPARLQCHFLQHEDMGCMKMVKFECPGSDDPQPITCKAEPAVQGAAGVPYDVCCGSGGSGRFGACVRVRACVCVFVVGRVPMQAAVWGCRD